MRFVGETEFGQAGEVWVGLEMDARVGSGDGSVDGVAYFAAKSKHAKFVRPGMISAEASTPMTPMTPMAI